MEDSLRVLCQHQDNSLRQPFNWHYNSCFNTRAMLSSMHDAFFFWAHECCPAQCMTPLLTGSQLGHYDVCWRMLTYADVCWRMLTYADVCWPMHVAFVTGCQHGNHDHPPHQASSDVMFVHALMCHHTSSVNLLLYTCPQVYYICPHSTTYYCKHPPPQASSAVINSLSLSLPPFLPPSLSFSLSLSLSRSLLSLPLPPPHTPCIFRRNVCLCFRVICLQSVCIRGAYYLDALMLVCVCVCVCVCLCLCLCVCTQKYTQPGMHVYTWVCACVCVWESVCICMPATRWLFTLIFSMCVCTWKKR